MLSEGARFGGRTTRCRWRSLVVQADRARQATAGSHHTPPSHTLALDRTHHWPSLNSRPRAGSPQGRPPPALDFRRLLCPLRDTLWPSFPLRMSLSLFMSAPASLFRCIAPAAATGCRRVATSSAMSQQAQPAKRSSDNADDFAKTPLRARVLSEEARQVADLVSEAGKAVVTRDAWAVDSAVPGMGNELVIIHGSFCLRNNTRCCESLFIG